MPTEIKSSPLVAASGEQSTQHNLINRLKEKQTMKSINATLTNNENLFNNKQVQRAYLDMLDAAFKQRHRNKAFWDETKSTVYKAYKDALQSGYDARLYRGLSDEDILSIIAGTYDMDVVEDNVREALAYLEETDIVLETLYRGYSIYLFGQAGMTLGHPQIKVSLLSDLRGVSPVVNGASASFSDVDVVSLYKYKAWAIMKDRINAITSAKKDTAFKAWMRLNAEIVIGDFKYNKEEMVETISKEGHSISVTTQGYGNAILNYYEEREFRRLNPARDGESPYPYDVRDTADTIAAIYEEIDSLEAKKAFRQRYEEVMTALVDGIQQPNVDIRDDEALKAKAKPNMNGVWFRAPKELATDVMEVTRNGVKEVLHLAHFSDFKDPSVKAFLRERAKIDAIDRAIARDRNEELRKQKVLKDFGLL